MSNDTANHADITDVLVEIRFKHSHLTTIFDECHEGSVYAFFYINGADHLGFCVKLLLQALGAV